MKFDDHTAYRGDRRTNQRPSGPESETTARGERVSDRWHHDTRFVALGAFVPLVGRSLGIPPSPPVMQVGFETVVGFVGLVGFGIAGLYFASKEYERYRAMADIEPTAIAALTPGIREVTGTVVSAGETLRSPLTDTDCVAYSHSRRSPNHDTDGDGDGLGTSRTTERAVPFYVEDASDRVFVNGPQADLALRKDERVWSGDSSQHESVLEAGDSVYVFGEVLTELPESGLGNGAFGEMFRTVGNAVPVDSTTKNEFVEAIRESATDRPDPRDGEFVVADGRSGHGLFISDGSERAGGRRQLLRVATFGGSGALLLLLAAFVVVMSVL